jgi:hypothetical protein
MKLGIVAMRKSLLNLVILFIIFVAGSWSLFSDSAFQVHDYTHVARFAEMARAIQEHHFPPRWSGNFGFGYGMPLYEFYAPLPYYIGGALHLLGVTSFSGVKILYLLTTGLTVWGAFLLGRRYFFNSGGLLVAALVTLAPYRALNLFVRGALSEAFGIMAIIWVLYFVDKFLEKSDLKNWLKLVFWLAVLFLSHNLITLVGLPFVGLFFIGLVLIKALNGQRSKSEIKQMTGIVLKTLGAVISATLMCAYYLLPAFLEKDFTRVSSQVITSYFDYQLHFLYVRQFFTNNWGYGGSEWGPDDPISFFLGWGQLFALALTLIFIALKLLSKKKVLIPPSLQKVLFFGGLTLVCIFFTNHRSVAIWQSVPLMSYLQFPWRFLSLAIIFTGIFGTGVLLILRPIPRFIAFTSLLIITLGNAIYFKPFIILDKEDGLYYSDKNKIRQTMSMILPDYIPIQMNPRWLEDNPASDQPIVCGDEWSCDFDYQVVTDKGHEKKIKTSFKIDSTITWAISDFPGWTTTIDGKEVAKTIDKAGFISTKVPAGEHEVGVKFASTKLRAVSDTISLVSVVLYLGAAVAMVLKSKKS